MLGNRKLAGIDEMATRRAFATLTQECGPYAANHALGVLSSYSAFPRSWATGTAANLLHQPVRPARYRPIPTSE